MYMYYLQITIMKQKNLFTGFEKVLFLLVDAW